MWVIYVLKVLVSALILWAAAETIEEKETMKDKLTPIIVIVFIMIVIWI